MKINLSTYSELRIPAVIKNIILWNTRIRIWAELLENLKIPFNINILEVTYVSVCLFNLEKDVHGTKTSKQWCNELLTLNTGCFLLHFELVLFPVTAIHVSDKCIF